MSNISSSLGDAKRTAEAIIRELDESDHNQNPNEDSKGEFSIKSRSKSPDNKASPPEFLRINL